MDGLKLSLITDQASFIERALAEVNQAIVFGGLLAILILYAFLSSWAQTFVIAVAMPLSVVRTVLCEIACSLADVTCVVFHGRTRT